MDHSPGFLAHVEGKRANVHEVSVEEALRATAADGASRLFDVREDHEYTARHAAGAEHLARGVAERDIERLVPDKGTPLYLYCGGGFRSALVADALQQMGYTAVHSVAGGWRAWQAASAPTEGPEPTVRIRVTDVLAAAAALEALGVQVDRNAPDPATAAGEPRLRLTGDDGNVVELWQGPA
jgi:rhodanese-related sulfurtransferase